MTIYSMDGEYGESKKKQHSYPLVMTNIAIENGHLNRGFSH